MCPKRRPNMSFHSSLYSYSTASTELEQIDRPTTTAAAAAMVRPTTKRISARGGGEADGVRWTRAAISKKQRRAVAAGRGVGRRIRTLRELVPGCSGGPAAKMGLEGLFLEAADYIVHLQVQVKAMQMLLRELSPPAAQADDGDDGDGD